MTDSTPPTPLQILPPNIHAVRQTPDGWEGAEREGGPWRPIPGPQTQPPFPVGADRWYPDFADWLKREMPEGTVIGDPLWWASKIASYLSRWGLPASPPAPEPEVGEGAIPSEYEWKDIGDGRPVRVQRCHKCGVCPSNVDDCGHFGDSRCPYFGIDAMAPTALIEP